jgi:sigma-B regulation protein RsbU (phosphoserine phosphatase)
MPLGVVADLEIAVPEAIEMAPGDVFAVMSDGVFEARDRREEPFGAGRAVDALRARLDQPPQRMLDGLRDALQRFTSGVPASDDRTVLLIKGTR